MLRVEMVKTIHCEYVCVSLKYWADNFNKKNKSYVRVKADFENKFGDAVHVRTGKENFALSLTF